jgi:hypothetical protein
VSLVMESLTDQRLITGTPWVRGFFR